MKLLSRRSRILTVAFALAQLALPGALRVVDAMTAGDGRTAVSHVEESSGLQCRAPHTDDCILCRHLSTSATRSSNAGIAAPLLTADAPTIAAIATPRSASH